MKNNDWKERLGVVYSTNPDFRYETAADNEPTTLPPNQQKLHVQKERRKGGKFVTVVLGFVGTTADATELARMLKIACGVGGTAKDGEIVIQGDVVDKVKAHLKSKNYKVS